MMLRLALLLLLIPLPLAAQELTLPQGFRLMAEDTSPAKSVRLPDRAFAPGTAPATAEGPVHRHVYQRSGSALTTLQITDPIEAALSEQGYQRVFACSDLACGGFDFRFQLDLLPEPDMHVDLGNYRYVLLRDDTAGVSVSLVASRSERTAFLHVTRVGGDGIELATEESPLPTETVTNSGEIAQDLPTSGELIERLIDRGSVTLGDLEFQSGSSALGGGDFASLDTLAAWLRSNPSARVALVGHTDATGSLDINVRISRQRAAAVVERLVDAHAVDPAQLQALGAGYMAPFASNLTDAGRAANRRVEAVLLSTDGQ